MQQHRPILFGEYCRSNLNLQVGPYSDQVLIKCCVMDLAHRDPVRHDGLAASHVGANVCCVQEFRMPQSAQSTGAVVRDQHASSEEWLVKALACHSLGVRP